MTNAKKRNNPNKEKITDVQITTKKLNFFQRFWKLITGIGLLLAIGVSLFFFIDRYKSPKQKFEEEKLAQGNLNPPILQNFTKEYTISETPPKFYENPPVNTLYPHIKGIYAKNIKNLQYVNVILGSLAVRCLVSDLYNGVNLFSPAFSNCTDSKLMLGLKDDRLYVSVEFKDLKKEETIGVIEFNHWSLYKDNLLDFNNDDERLEVKDKQNNIVFSIQYFVDMPNDPEIYIRGYFISPYDILVLTDRAIADKNGVEFNKCLLKTDSNWKQKAEFRIQDIKSIF